MDFDLDDDLRSMKELARDFTEKKIVITRWF